MSIQTATPYLILNGKADQAIEFYQQALRANVETRMLCDRGTLGGGP